MGQSLLELAHALHHQVSALSSEASPSPHPLALRSTDPLASLALLRTRTHRQLELLRHAIARFSLQLASGLEPDVAADSPARDRYLSQLKDAAASQAAILALQDLVGRDVPSGDLQQGARGTDSDCDWDRERYRVETPHRTGTRRRGPTTLQLLERIAQQLQLVTFRDHEDEDGGAGDRDGDEDVTMADAVPVTLSVGGKLMVVDFTAPSARSDRIDHVKVAYVIGGHDKQSTLAAKKLERLFSPPPCGRDGDGPEETGSYDDKEEEERDEWEQTRWKGVRRLLRELKGLDNVAEQTGRDAFEELEQLTSHFETVHSNSGVTG